TRRRGCRRRAAGRPAGGRGAAAADRARRPPARSVSPHRGGYAGSTAQTSEKRVSMAQRGGQFGGQPNMQQLMKQAQKMQQQMEVAQAELAATEIIGSAGGGLV